MLRGVSGSVVLSGAGRPAEKKGEVHKNKRQTPVLGRHCRVITCTSCCFKQCGGNGNRFGRNRVVSGPDDKSEKSNLDPMWTPLSSDFNISVLTVRFSSCNQMIKRVSV